jgi:uncharacterized protein (DUF2147 family)
MSGSPRVERKRTSMPGSWLIHFKVIMKTFSLVALCFAFLTLPAHADDLSPVGLWKSYDDAGQNAKAFIRITEQNGVLTGRIEKLIRPASENQNPLCTKCTGADKDQPLTGMVILNKLTKAGDEYAGGEIFDPEVGKSYKCKLKLLDGGKKMNVRGYIGVPMLGRSQVWQRQE